MFPIWPRWGAAKSPAGLSAFHPGADEGQWGGHSPRTQTQLEEVLAPSAPIFQLRRLRTRGPQLAEGEFELRSACFLKQTALEIVPMGS